MGRKARAVILTHLHGHPHVLLFKPTDRGRDSGRPAFKLPGGTLKTEESETEGLQRVLAQLLAPTAEQEKASVEFEVVDLVSTWWRPDFDDRVYPYLPVVSQRQTHGSIHCLHGPCTHLIAARSVRGSRSSHSCQSHIASIIAVAYCCVLLVGEDST